MTVLGFEVMRRGLGNKVRGLSDRLEVSVFWG